MHLYARIPYCHWQLFLLKGIKGDEGEFGPMGLPVSRLVL